MSDFTDINIDIERWKMMLFDEICLLQDPDNLKYLTRKVSVMVEREQKSLGNHDYRSVFTDPDIQDPGG